MRLHIEHHTRYRFSEPQARLVQLLRLFPGEAAHQTPLDWRIDVDCDARLRDGRDGYGNPIRMLYAEGPVNEIGITVTGEVLLADAQGRVTGTAEPMPPSLFQRATPLTAASPELADYSAGAAGEAGGDAERLRRLCAALPQRWRVVHDHHATIRAAELVFAGTEATPRCLAQLFVAAARSLGIPARYVSGYSLDGDADRRSAAPHGWAEAFVEGKGWYAFDPSIGAVPGFDHVRLAVALDAAGAAPIAGMRIGQGEEVLDVAVHVAGVEAD